MRLRGDKAVSQMIVRRLMFAFLIALIVPAVALADVEFRLGLRYDTFPGNVLVLFMWPGYQCAAILFCESARSESAGILLYPAASVFNVVIYTAAIYAAMSLVSSRSAKGRRNNMTSVSVAAITCRFRVLCLVRSRNQVYGS